MELDRVEEYLKRTRGKNKQSESELVDYRSYLDSEEYKNFLNSRREKATNRKQNQQYWIDDKKYADVMNENVRYLLNKRYKTYHFGSKKKEKDSREYGFFKDSLTSNNRSELEETAMEYASRRTKGRTASEAEAWKADREKANARLQEEFESEKNIVNHLPNYLTGESNHTNNPYMAVEQSGNYWNQIEEKKRQLRETQKRREEKEKEISKEGFMAPPFANPIKYNEIERMEDYEKQVNAAKNMKRNPVENAYSKMEKIGVGGKGITPEKIVEMTNGIGGNKYVQDLRQYALLTDEERNRYNYIISRSGEKAANYYLQTLQDEINYRGALSQYKKTQSIPKAVQTPINVGKSFLSGVENSFRGVKAIPDLYTGKAGDYSVSESEYYQGLLDEDSSGLKNMGYKVSAGIGNMALSIMIGALSGGAGAAGTAGAAAGVGRKAAALAARGALQESLFAAQTAGQAYREDIMEGRPVEGAQINAVLTGADEAITNWLLNGVSQFGGGKIKKAMGNTKVIQAARRGITSALSKNPVLLNQVNRTLDYGTDMLFEGTQESVQVLTESLRKNLIYGDELDLIGDLQDPQTWENFAVGALTAGVMNAPGAIYTGKEINDYGKSINHDYRDFSEGIDTDENNYNSYQDYLTAKELKQIAEGYVSRQKKGEYISNYEKADFEMKLNEFMRDLAEHNAIPPEYSPITEQRTIEVNKEEGLENNLREGPTYENVEELKNVEPVKEVKKTESVEINPWAKAYGKKGEETFLNVYDGNTDIETFYRAFSRYYNAGRYNMDIKDADKTMLAAMITPDQAAAAYKSGAQDRNLEAGFNPKTGKIDQMIQTEPKTGGLKEATENATEEQKIVAEAFGKRTGLSFVLVDGTDGELSSYEPGKVKISIESDNFNASISHEMTHFIKDYSPDLYQPFQDTVIKAITESRAASIDELIQSYTSAYERAGQDLSRSQVLDEIVADATEKFLNEPEYVDKIVRENRTFGEKILDFIIDIIDTIKSIMKTGSTRKAAKGLEENLSYYETARTVWMTALEEAGDRYKSGVEIKKAEIGIEQEADYHGEKSVQGQQDKRMKDLRYQLEDVDDYSDRFLELIHENEELREANKLLEKQFKITSKNEMRQEDIHKITKKLLNTYQSTLNEQVAQRNITRFFEIIRSSDQVDGKEVSEVATDIARSILKNSKQIDSELTQQYKDLRKKIRETKINITNEDKADLAAVGGYNTFRKKYFGRMKLGEDGISVDSFYEELSSMYPELFESKITHPADRLIEIGNIIDMTQEQVNNPYHANMDEMSYIVGQELLDAYFDIRAEKPTYADKKAVEINRIKREYRKKLDKFKQSRITQYEAIIGEKNQEIKNIKNEYNRELAVQKEKFNKKLQSRRDSLKRSDLKKRIIKETKNMQTWLINPTDSKHIPEGLRGAVAGFLNNIDFSSNDTNILTQRTIAWNEAHKIFEGILNNESIISDSGNQYYIEIDPDLPARINGLIEKTKGIGRLEDLDTYSLEELQKAVLTMKKTLNEINAMKGNQTYRKVSLIAEDVMKDTEKFKNRKEYTWVTGEADKLFNYDMISPLTMFEKVGPAFKSVYDSIRAGLDKKTVDIEAAEKYIKEIMQDTGITTKDIRDWSGANAKTQTFQVKGGEIKLTISQIMSLYELNKRNQARGHIYDKDGGIKPSERQVGFLSNKNEPQLPYVDKTHRVVKVNEEDVKRIISVLSPEQMKLADSIQKFLGNEIASWGNEVSMEMYGYEKFRSKDYFPIKTDNNYISEKEGKDQKKVTIRNLGFTKNTVQHANNPLIIEDIFDVFTRQVDQMSSYNAYVIPLSDLHKVMNYKDMRGINGYSIKQEIERAFGKHGIAYIDKLVEDINGSINHDSNIWEKLLSNMKAASVAGNLRVAIQQPTAIIRACTEISPKYLAMGTANFLNEKKQWELVCKYAPIAQWKEWGFYRMQTSRQMKDILFGTDNVKQRFVNKSMIFAEYGDKIAWNRLWKACEYECMDTHPELKKGEEEFYRQVGKRFSEIVDKTQVVDSVLHRTQIMRDTNGIVKLSTSFMAEPLKTYNMIYRAGMYLQRGIKGSGELAAKTAAVYVANAFFISLAAASVDAMRDDDRKKSYKEKYWEYVEQNIKDNLNIINSIPFGKDVLSIGKGYTPVRADMSAIQDIGYASVESAKYYTGKSKYTLNYVILNSLQSSSKFLGIPIKSITRDAVSIIDIVYQAAGGEADYKWLKLKYDIGSDQNRSKYVELMLRTQETGNKKLAEKIKADMLKSGVPEEKINDSLSLLINKKIKEEVNIVESILDYDTTDKYTRLSFENDVDRYIELKAYAGWDKKKSLEKIREIITEQYKPLWESATTQKEKDTIIKKCKSFYYEGDSIYKGYDFNKNWKRKKAKE